LITASAGITLPLTSGVYLTNNNWPNTVISPSITSYPTNTLSSYDYSPGTNTAVRFIFGSGANDTVSFNVGNGIILILISGVYSITGSFGIATLSENITGLYNRSSLTMPVCVGNPSFTYNSYIAASESFVVVKCFDQGNDYNFATVTITRLY
jgi:hypothetical protein